MEFEEAKSVLEKYADNLLKLKDIEEHIAFIDNLLLGGGMVINEAGVVNKNHSGKGLEKNIDKKLDLEKKYYELLEAIEYESLKIITAIREVEKTNVLWGKILYLQYCNTRRRKNLLTVSEELCYSYVYIREQNILAINEFARVY